MKRHRRVIGRGRLLRNTATKDRKRIIQIAKSLSTRLKNG